MSYFQRFRRAPATAAAIVASAAVATTAVLVMSLVLRVEPDWPPRLVSRVQAIVADPGTWGASWEALAQPPSVFPQRALAALVRLVAQLGGGTIAIAVLSLMLHAAGRILAQWRPLAIRCALGARLRHLMQQVAIELIVLGAAGCAVGLLAGGGIAALMRATWPALTTRPALVGVAAGTALAVAGILGLLGTIALLFLYPLQRRARVVADLQGEHVTTPGGMLLLQNGLAALQMAGLLVVTYGSLLILRGTAGSAAFGQVPWNADSLAVAHMRVRGNVAPPAEPARGRAEDAASVGARSRLWSRLFTERAAGGRVAVSSPDAWLGLGRELPLLGLCGSCFVGSNLVPITHATARAQLVGPGALAAMGLTLRRGGREFTAADTLGAAPVVVLSGALAARLFPTPDIVGKPVWAGLGASAAYRVIGIVSDIAPRGLGSSGAPLPIIYFALLQHPPDRAQLTLPVSDTSDLATLRAVTGADAAIGAPESLGDRTRTFDAPIGWFAALFGALAVASLGIGLLALATVMSEVVALRRRDIAIRLALGARPHHVVLWILGKALAVTGAGVMIGLSLARWIGDLMGATLSASDVAGIYLLGTMALGFGAAGIMASLLPALRAARVQPASIWAEPGT